MKESPEETVTSDDLKSSKTGSAQVLRFWICIILYKSNDSTCLVANDEDRIFDDESTLWSLKRDEAALREKQEVVTRSPLNAKPSECL
ncbi:hypothetical protein ACRRTK_003285 [Alexandromys fortis]